ncbi:MAG: 2-amino-4-hydroxy-6-hydroxymethyldihydropteridine diphosphokinase [Proteobacteria bacterium]|nr:2-amino-4-hydroxy-6-hydroxymethyldihydropteridine diphosphokinase [Pseudomonadota bacterium]
MIVIGIGSNLPHREFGRPLDVGKAAISYIEQSGIRIAGLSPWYKTDPVGTRAQPSYVNAVVIVRTGLGPHALLKYLRATEALFGRKRSFINAPRTLDLDIIAYDALSIARGNLTIPHPRYHERAFVLRPLADIAPSWRDPQSGKSAETLLREISDQQQLSRIA